MDEQFDYATWEELEEKLLELDNTAVESGHSHLLYRGQANHEWELQTTLERSGARIERLTDYYRSIAIAKTRIETFTEKAWPEIDYLKIDPHFRNYDALRNQPPPAYEFLVYLRHHGFPSPLLDWTSTPYIAAFFAFQSVPKDAKRVAIWVYQEHSGSGKHTSSRTPQIKQLGPYIRSDRRHFLQQGEYTLAVTFQEGEWCFVPHASIFNDGNRQCDHLIKLTLPKSETDRVMSKLDRMNINTYSLFQTEDALLETTWRKLKMRFG